MPNLSVDNAFKCKNCIHSIKRINGNKIYYECSPVREYSDRKKAIDNCITFYDTRNIQRDIYIIITAFVLYPKFDQQDTGIGLIFRGLNVTDGELLNNINTEEFINEVKNKLPEAGYRKETLFEPIIFAERNCANNEWKCISAIFDEDTNNKLLNTIKENFKQ